MSSATSLVLFGEFFPPELSKIPNNAECHMETKNKSVHP